MRVKCFCASNTNWPRNVNILVVRSRWSAPWIGRRVSGQEWNAADSTTPRGECALLSAQVSASIANVPHTYLYFTLPSSSRQLIHFTGDRCPSDHLDYAHLRRNPMSALPEMQRSALPDRNSDSSAVNAQLTSNSVRPGCITIILPVIGKIDSSYIEVQVVLLRRVESDLVI